MAADQFMFNLQEVQRIATYCRNKGEQMTQEAQDMKNQIQRLHEAIQGIPHIALEDHFGEMTHNFTQLSDSMEHSNAYLAQLLTRVQELMHGIQGLQ